MRRLLRYGFGVLLALATGLAVAGDASVRGTLLVAARDMTDTPFARTVILVIEHDDDGAQGLVLNRPTDRSLSDVIPAAVPSDSKRDRPLYSGGPVRPRQLSMLVRTTTPHEGVDQVLPGVGHTSRAPVFNAILEQASKGAGIRVFAGYAGWAPGQLDHEIDRGSWHILDASADAVFNRSNEGLWQRMLERLPASTGRQRRPL